MDRREPTAPITITAATTTTSAEDLQNQTPSQMKNLKQKVKEVTNIRQQLHHYLTPNRITLILYQEVSPYQLLNLPHHHAPQMFSTLRSSHP